VAVLAGGRRAGRLLTSEQKASEATRGEESRADSHPVGLRGSRRRPRSCGFRARKDFEHIWGRAMPRSAGYRRASTTGPTLL